MSEILLPLRATVLLLLLLFSYVVGVCLAASRDTKPGFGAAIASMTTGACFLSFLFLVVKLFESTVIAAIIAATVMVPILRRWRAALAPRAEYTMTQIACSLVVIAVGLMPTVIMGLRMGFGDSPDVFFAVDSPFFLSHVHALMGTHEYPPQSLEAFDLSFRYQYGFQGLAALASTITGLTPHFVMFAALVPIVELLTALLVYDIGRRLTGSHGQALLVLVLFLFGSKQYFADYLDPSILVYLTEPEFYNFRYPSPPSAIGLLMYIAIGRALLDFESRHWRRTALLLVAMLPVFKIPYVIPAGAGLALVYLYEQRRMFSAERLGELIAAGTLSFASLTLFATDRSAGFWSSTIRLDAFGFSGLMISVQSQTLLVFGAAIVVTALARRMPVSRDGTVRLWLFVASSFAVFAGLTLDSPAAAAANSHQLFDPVVKAAVIVMSAYFVEAWLGPRSNRALIRSIGVVALVGLAGPGAVSQVHHTYIVGRVPERGHEYVDNTLVADALRHIPLEGTLIAANDLRYPANDYVRDRRQLQLAGLFGHQNMASNSTYGTISPEQRDLYERRNGLFQREEWPEVEIDRLRAEVPLTHVLVHETYVHAEDIPLSIEYQNEEYTVYVFEP